MPENYTEPVAALLTFGGIEWRRCDDPWPDYRELGLSAEHVPDLIRMATDEALHRSDPDGLNVWAPLHAWRALGQLRAEPAAEALVQLFAELPDDDWIPNELPIVFSMIGPPAIPALAAFLGDDSIDEVCRISVPACLERIARDHPAHRDVCISVLMRQLERFKTNGSTLNGFLVLSLVELRATQAIALIRSVYSKKRVDLTVLGDVEDAEIEMGIRAQRSSPRPRLSAFHRPAAADSCAEDEYLNLPLCAPKRSAGTTRVPAAAGGSSRSAVCTDLVPIRWR